MRLLVVSIILRQWSLLREMMKLHKGLAGFAKLQTL